MVRVVGRIAATTLGRIMPPGTPHAVYTPADCLAIGGVFLAPPRPRFCDLHSTSSFDTTKPNSQEDQSPPQLNKETLAPEEEERNIITISPDPKKQALKTYE